MVNNQNHVIGKNERRFYELYGYTIAKEGIAPIPVSLFRYQHTLGLSFQEVSFICHLLSYRWTSSDPYPSIERLSELTGVSAKTLHAYKKSLIEKRKLKVYNRFDQNGGQLTNGYDLTPLFMELEKIISEKEGCENITHPPITPASQGGITSTSHELDPIQVDNVVVEQPQAGKNNQRNTANESSSDLKKIAEEKTLPYRPEVQLPGKDVSSGNSEGQASAQALQLLAKETCGTEIPVKFFKSLLQEYSEAAIKEKLQLLAGVEIRNVPGWLIAALKNRYKNQPGSGEKRSKKNNRKPDKLKISAEEAVRKKELVNNPHLTATPFEVGAWGSVRR